MVKITKAVIIGASFALGGCGTLRHPQVPSGTLRKRDKFEEPTFTDAQQSCKWNMTVSKVEQKIEYCTTTIYTYILETESLGSYSMHDKLNNTNTHTQRSDITT